MNCLFSQYPFLFPSKASKNQHVPQNFDFSATESILRQIAREDEPDCSKYVALFYPILSQEKEPLALLRNGLSLWKEPVGKNEQTLVDLLTRAKTWLLKEARHMVSLVPGNHRAALLIFEGQDPNEIKQNTTFTHRAKDSPLLLEMLYFLRFAFRHSRRNEFDWSQSVPEILMSMLLEKTPNFMKHTIAIEYCLYRSLRITTNNKLTMSCCKVVASQVSATLSILRSGVCSFLCFIQADADCRSSEIVATARSARTSNILAPMIRRLRESGRRKPKKRMCTVSPEGDIAVDGYLFEKKKWSSLIPSVYEACVCLLSRMFVGMDWKKLLDLSRLIFVHKGNLVGPKELVDDLTFSEEINISDYDILGSYVVTAFHSFGLSSTRVEELGDKLSTSQLRWHRGTIYYYTQSIKRYSHQSRDGDMVEHKLPGCMARIFLLFRKVASFFGMDKSHHALPIRDGSNRCVGDVMAEIFQLQTRPTSTDIRQLITSVCNIIFPNNELVLQGRVVATDEVAESAGHAAGTQAQCYPTLLVNGREKLYLSYHKALGDVCGLRADITRSIELTTDDLADGLRLLFGPSATYRSRFLQEMVRITSVTGDRHTHISLGCGEGKSVSWILPVACRVMLGLPKVTTIVILPYKFLVAYHHHTSSKLMSESIDAIVESLVASDMNSSTLPECISDIMNLPDLLFLSIDAAMILIEQFESTLREWTMRRLVDRIFIDEVHTVFGESFRTAYECLRCLASYRIPVCTLSGSFPVSFIQPIHRYLHLSLKDDSSDIDVVQGIGLLGNFPDGFRLRCVKSHNIIQSVTDEVSAIRARHVNHAVHVLATTKQQADCIFECLRKKWKSALLSSDSDDDYQTAVAFEWSEGKIDILISTTIALVGNECKRCHHVVVAGYLYNLTNIVQALGRLRSPQRIKEGTFTVHLASSNASNYCDQNDNDLFAVLNSRHILSSINRGTFNDVLTTKGVQDVFLSGKDCYVMAISRRFGQKCLPCRVCDNCISSPVASSSRVCNSDMMSTRDIAHQARRIMQKLIDDRCLVCYEKNCTGIECLQGKCGNCGGDHGRNSCPISWNKLVFDKACWACLDYKYRESRVRHEIGQCPMKYRFKRCIIQGYSMQQMYSFTEFVKGIYSCEGNFNKFLVDVDEVLHKRRM